MSFHSQPRLPIADTSESPSVNQFSMRLQLLDPMSMSRIEGACRHSGFGLCTTERFWIKSLGSRAPFLLELGIHSVAWFTFLHYVVANKIWHLICESWYMAPTTKNFMDGACNRCTVQLWVSVSTLPQHNRRQCVMYMSTDVYIGHSACVGTVKPYTLSSVTRLSI